MNNLKTECNIVIVKYKSPVEYEITVMYSNTVKYKIAVNVQVL